MSACQPSSSTTDHNNDVPNIAVRDGALVSRGTVFDMKGICWNPIPKGEPHPAGLAFLTDGPAYNLDFIERDLQLITEAGFNTIRPYKVITDNKVLDLIDTYGLKTIVPIFIHHQTSLEEVEAVVALLKDHPTTLIWEIGNEWNYNNFYNPDGNYEQSVSSIHEVITAIRSIDWQIPISTNYGEIPSKELANELGVDLWGLNIYRADDFGDAFEKWQTVSDKPIYIGEYGADAIDNRNGDARYSPEDQAYAVEKLTSQIISQYASQGRGPLIGGALFEFSDEWWKDGSGLPSEHDKGGVAPGGGPYPDLEFNEEWWGIVDINRNPRPAYHSIKSIYNP